MGVEYTHGLFVADTEWRATWTHVEQIDVVLQRWGFRRTAAPYYALGNGNADRIDEPTARGMPANLMVAYDTLDGELAARLLGPSKYSTLRDEDRYIMSTFLHVGVDYKVLQAEGEEVELVALPTTNGRDISPEFNNALPGEVTVYPATWLSTRPETDGPKRFDRVWRAALLLDCHKDVPAIATAAANLPDRDFVLALEAAIGTPLVEAGWLH